MKTFRDIKKTTQYIKALKKKGKTIGLVPTMGYLHEGHLSLIRRSRKDNDISVISIFVNPTQFGPGEDFKKYPRNFKRDERLAQEAGVDIIFYPAARAMYPEGYKTSINVGALGKRLCGASRPGHFQGVATVVAKLFNIVEPDTAYFGQKDAQQAIIIKKLTEDLDMPVKVKVMPIVREPDGLAMSSRNTYLSNKERAEALILNKALKKAGVMIKSGEKNASKVKKEMRSMINSKKQAKIDYVSVVDSGNLQELKTIKKGALIALAVKIGKTRLIDNTIIK